ncbi:MAG: hypothetical protein JNM58_02930 [Xanthomonadaceae bacterium]|nr:hypothetical protein [Xanthomonadaceae bacterium]
MEKLKDNWIRFAYVFVSVAVAIAASRYKSDVLASTDSLNEFSYVGTVATVIGLIIAASEVVHSLRVSIAIRKEANKLFSAAKALDGASSISECLSSLDEVGRLISSEDYEFSLRCFQHFRRTYARVPGNGAEIVAIDTQLNDIELGLHQAVHTRPQAPLEKKKRIALSKGILSIKESLEKINPVRGSVYASN